MKIIEAISRVDDLRPNVYTQEQKIWWLSNLDGKLGMLFAGGHDGAAGYVPVPYTVDDIEDELLVPFPFDDLYIYYLMAQIDFSNGEIQRYNNDMELYNVMLSDYEKQQTRGTVHECAHIRYF